MIGTTFDANNPNIWRMARWSRYSQIISDVKRRKPTRWLAVDDDGLGWPADDMNKLVLTPPDLGLRCAVAQEEFIARMRDCFW